MRFKRTAREAASLAASHESQESAEARTQGPRIANRGQADASVRLSLLVESCEDGPTSRFFFIVASRRHNQGCFVTKTECIDTAAVMTWESSPKMVCRPASRMACLLSSGQYLRYLKTGSQSRRLVFHGGILRIYPHRGLQLEKKVR